MPDWRESSCTRVAFGRLGKRLTVFWIPEEAMPRETRVTGCETRREAVSVQLGNGQGSVDGRTTELRLVGMQHRVHRQAAMSARELGDQPGGNWMQRGRHVWRSGGIEAHFGPLGR